MLFAAGRYHTISVLIRIEFRRFGVFSVKPRKTGIGRNPPTGEEFSISPGKAVRFKPGKELQGIEAAKKA